MTGDLGLFQSMAFRSDAPVSGVDFSDDRMGYFHVRAVGRLDLLDGDVRRQWMGNEPLLFRLPGSNWLYLNSRGLDDISTPP
jgi:hypothetical protein